MIKIPIILIVAHEKKTIVHRRWRIPEENGSISAKNRNKKNYNFKILNKKMSLYFYLGSQVHKFNLNYIRTLSTFVHYVLKFLHKYIYIKLCASI